MILLFAIILAFGSSISSACTDTTTLTPESPSYSFEKSINQNGYSECSWVINAPEGTSELSLTCSISTSSTTGCSSAFFSYTAAGKTETFCGPKQISRTLQAQSATIVFKSFSDVNINSQYTGIDCTIFYTPKIATKSLKQKRESCECGMKGGSQIEGGNQTTPNLYPWQAILKQRHGSPFCGGSLIAKNWVLTATRCLGGRVASSIQVVFGQQDFSTQNELTQTIDVESFISHKNFEVDTFWNDIALIKLKTPATFNKVVSPVCLPFLYKDVDISGQTGTLAGWGLTEHGQHTGALTVVNEVDLTILSNIKCTQPPILWPPYIVTKNMICGHSGNAGTCQGDSGGPFIWMNPSNQLYYEMGIVSFGYICGVGLYPTVFTKVQNYLDWIKQNTGAGPADGMCEK